MIPAAYPSPFLGEFAVSHYHLCFVLLTSGTLVAFGTPVSAQSSPPGNVVGPPARRPDPSHDDQFRDWREKMRKSIPDRKGCFRVQHPDLTWKEIPCASNQHAPLKRAGPPLENVGGSFDVIARLTSENISSVSGIFLNVSGLTSMQDSGTNNSAFSLQINSNHLSSVALCNGRPATCRGWQQFVFVSDGAATNSIFMQYWIVDYNRDIATKTCPSGWMAHGDHCYKNSDSHTYSGQNYGPSRIPKLHLNAYARATGVDTVEFYEVGGDVLTINGQDSIFGLTSRWTEADFNIFGYSSRSTIVFNPGTTMTLSLLVSGTTNGLAPTACVESTSTTAEKNNLTVRGACCPEIGGITFTESNAASGDSVPYCRAFAPIFF
jgi:hypothetical protein